MALPLPGFDGPAWAHYAARAAVAAEIHAAIADVLLREDSAKALTRLAAADVPVAEVTRLDELAASPALSGRQRFVETCVGPLLRFPVQMQGLRATVAALPPPE